MGACSGDSEIRQTGLRKKLGNRGDGADLLRRREREEGVRRAEDDCFLASNYTDAAGMCVLGVLWIMDTDKPFFFFFKEKY